jgi:rod shape-determining protein MreB
VSGRHPPDRNGGTRTIRAAGQQAKRMLRRTPENITDIQPMKDGVIADFTTSEKMLQYFIRKMLQSRMLRPSPRVLICAPVGATGGTARNP